MKQINSDQDILKSHFEKNWNDEPFDSKKGIPRPQSQKPCLSTNKLINLISPDEFKFDIKLQDAIKNRHSFRKFTKDFLTLKELAFLLWATQGVTDKNIFTHRTVPAAGGSHPFETYLVIRRVKDLKPGIYRYLPLDHKLCLISDQADVTDKISASCFDQPQTKEAAIVFVWTAIPYRTEWRFGEHARKFTALDAGHVCQNLYLATEAIHCGTCAVTIYQQEEVDKIIGVDGKDEFAVYLATVGKVA